MANIESVKKANHFIMLDILNTIREKANSMYYPIVQIVYPSNENAYQNIKIVKSYIENSFNSEGKIIRLFTITLNIDADTKDVQFQ